MLMKASGQNSTITKSDKETTMIDPDKLICYCNDLTVKDIATFIKENDIKNLDELIEQTDFPVGDKCETCHENGYLNDGYSLAMVLGQVKQGRL